MGHCVGKPLADNKGSKSIGGHKMTPHQIKMQILDPRIKNLGNVGVALVKAAKAAK